MFCVNEIQNISSYILYLRSSSAADKPAIPAPMIIVSASKNVWEVSGVAKTQILYACQFNEQNIYLLYITEEENT